MIVVLEPFISKNEFSKRDQGVWIVARFVVTNLIFITIRKLIAIRYLQKSTKTINLIITEMETYTRVSQHAVSVKRKTN